MKLYWLQDAQLHIYDIVNYEKDLSTVVSNIDFDVDGTFIKSKLSQAFIPKRGSDIYVAPNCPYASADIRACYNVKRAVDSGCCNVFSRVPRREHWNIIFKLPDRDEVYLENSWKDETIVRQEVCSVLAKQGYPRYNAGSLVKLGAQHINYYNLPDVWDKLLFGQLQKPAISYKMLDINPELELTDDAVELVYRSGIVDYSQDNETKCLLEINALCRHNYQKYPKTISILKSLMRERAYYGTFNSITHRTSSQTKVVQQFLKFPNALAAASQEDHDMAKRLVLKLMGMEDKKLFVQYDDVARKASSNRIPLHIFHSIFDTVVKIQPKEYEAVDNTVQEKQG